MLDDKDKKYFDSKFEAIDQKFEKVDQKFEKVDQKFVTNERFDSAMDAVGERFDALEAGQQEQKEILLRILRSQERAEADHGVLVEHGKRIKKLEKIVGVPSL